MINTLVHVLLRRTPVGKIEKRVAQLIYVATRGRVMSSIGQPLPSEDIPFKDLVAKNDVIIMKHCYPSSDVLEDIGSPDPSSERKSIENYKTVYRLLRAEFEKHPDTIFIVWTPPPLHRLATNSNKAVRATEFSEWLKTDFLTEDDSHPNIYVWDVREILMDSNTNFLKSEYERSHKRADSHPNKKANNMTGPRFAQFIIDSIADFTSGINSEQKAKIIFLHHSTGRNVYKYPELGIPDWFDSYNDAHRTEFEISEVWYPLQGNMPVHYYRSWLVDR
ncbi:MAG: hypothetical protein GY845_02020 [Planctomycetes bacterium]|nr:hypothetical protein [Planctomycetota bacterium]